MKNWKKNGLSKEKHVQRPWGRNKKEANAHRKNPDCRVDGRGLETILPVGARAMASLIGDVGVRYPRVRVKGDDVTGRLGTGLAHSRHSLPGSLVLAPPTPTAVTGGRSLPAGMPGPAGTQMRPGEPACPSPAPLCLPPHPGLTGRARPREGGHGK